MRGNAQYFLFCVDEGYLEIPENSQIHNLGGFIAGKYRTGEYFVYFNRANGGHGKFLSLFRFITFQKAFNALFLYLQLYVRKLLWLIFFFMPSAICFACIYSLQHNSFIQKNIYIALTCGAALTLTLAFFLSKIHALRTSAASYYVCLNRASPTKAIKKRG